MLYQNLEKIGEASIVNDTVKIVVKKAAVVDFLK